VIVITPVRAAGFGEPAELNWQLHLRVYCPDSVPENGSAPDICTNNGQTCNNNYPPAALRRLQCVTKQDL
jgi:hypothetical protein